MGIQRSSASPKNGETVPPNFRSMYCGQMAGWVKMPLGSKIGFGRGDIVLDGDQAHPPLKRHSPQVSAHVCCGQTAGSIKMPFGTEVGLGPGDIVLDRDPVPLPQRGTAPQFSAYVCCGETARRIKMPHGRKVGHLARTTLC